MTRRESQRRRAAKQRLRKQAQRNAGQVVCQVGFCGGMLETDFDDLGRTIVRCRQCERRRAGICRDCPRPVEGQRGKALRCAEHKAAAIRSSVRASEVRHHDVRLAAARQSYQDPEVRARRNDYKRAWRKANPEKVREQKRRYVQRQGCARGSRYREYHRRYNADPARIRKKREAARTEYYVHHPVRPIPHCVECNREIPWPPSRSGRPPKRCTFHRNKYDVRDAALRWAARDEAAAATPAAPPATRSSVPRLRIRHPQPARYADSGERLCATPGCDIVLTGRKKKCTKCRVRQQAEARAALSPHAGRGRRVDLEQRAL